MAVAAAAMMADSLHGAAITWGPASDIAGDTDVINTGALVYAYEWGTMPSTINGVSFTSSYTVNGGTNVFFVPNSLDSGSTYFSSSSPPFSALSSAYITILEGAVYVAAGNPFSVEVTLANLTIGRKYAVQVWVNDPRGPYNDRSETITSPGGNTVTLDFSTNALNKAGGPGQYTVGTFTADATNQTFTLMGNPAAYVTQLNALQVRDVGTQTLPAWSGINPAGAGAVQLIFQGASGGEYTVLTTTDISTPIANWTPLPNGAGIFGVIAITNISPATNKARFYRIRSP
ncbi:MAG TPA: hypothetical protein VKY92_07085 [Verrucomicrobiae bacterium]|nr:hypothetical protein [Verrucomicrobiae bacterium]